jgi:hypothetical protein
MSPIAANSGAELAMDRSIPQAPIRSWFSSLR